MKVARWVELDEAALAVPDGAWVAPGGFMLSRAPIALDVALVHAHAADDAGNLFVEHPTTDLLVARAARFVIATCETRVRRLASATIPGFLVDLVVEEPFGAYPLGCFGRYAPDEAHLRR